MGRFQISFQFRHQNFEKFFSENFFIFAQKLLLGTIRACFYDWFNTFTSFAKNHGIDLWCVHGVVTHGVVNFVLYFSLPALTNEVIILEQIILVKYIIGKISMDQIFFLAKYLGSKVYSRSSEKWLSILTWIILYS